MFLLKIVSIEWQGKNTCLDLLKANSRFINLYNDLTFKCCAILQIN